VAGLYATQDHRITKKENGSSQVFSALLRPNAGLEESSIDIAGDNCACCRPTSGAARKQRINPMTHTSSGFSKKSLIVGLLVALVTVIGPGAQAAFTNHFDALEAELQARSTALTGSADKTEQKQKKAVDKIIVTIDKPATSLDADVKTAGKVAKSLAKAFPSEFVTMVVFTNNIDVLLGNVFQAFEADVTDRLTSLSNTVSALPNGSAKTKAQAKVVTAQTALTAANNAPDFATEGKSLASALKAISSGIKSAGSGGGGGGGGCKSSTLTMTVSNEGPVWHSTTAVAATTHSTGDFTLGATRGASPNPFDTVAIGTFPITAAGDYPIGQTSVGGTSDYVSGALTANTVSYALVTGTIHVATFQAAAVGGITGSTSGTFSFSAQDNLNNVITLDGSFDICNMVTLP
jgi:hypothetical protein